MRFSTISAIAAFAATALAQDLSSLPTCGTACVGSGLTGTGCNQIDIACICKSSGWIDSLSCCVSQACDTADQDTIIKFAQQICQPVGVTNLPTKAGCSGTNTPSGTGSATASGAGSATSAAGSAASSISAVLSSGASQITSAASSAASAATASGAAVAPAPTAFGLAGVAAAAGLFAAAL